jgi:GTP cyclohydrolase I
MEFGTMKTHLSWSEVIERARWVAAEIRVGDRIFGVPRGGAIVAGLIAALRPDVVCVDDPLAASVMVDDIIDSGRTRDRFFLGRSGESLVRFLALVDKTQGDRDLGWVVFPWEASDVTVDLESTVVRQLQMIGEDPTRPGMLDTPRRYLRALQELTAGLGQDPAAPLAKQFDESHNEIVCVRGIEFVSLCEHHLLPFVGAIDFAYVPNGKVVGLSKIPRMIEVLARRPQVQERLTTEIATVFESALRPLGVMVVVEGEHSCMRARGVKSKGSMVTSVVRGCFMEKPEARAEALALMRR